MKNVFYFTEILLKTSSFVLEIFKEILAGFTLDSVRKLYSTT